MSFILIIIKINEFQEHTHKIKSMNIANEKTKGVLRKGRGGESISHCP